MTISIPIQTTYDGGKGFDLLRKDAARAEREALASNRRQITEHRKAVQLTARMDKDLAAERSRNRQKLQTGAGAVLGAGAILGAAGAEAVSAARESIASENELQAALNSSGKAAAGYKNELTALSTALEDNSNFTDEAIQHAQALLLTFDKVGRDVMPRATQSVIDLAELMDGDLQGAAQAVGKAMEGNLGAIERTTGKFTDAEKEKIAALFETGQVAEAQTIILGKLEDKVSGQAKAARDAAGGWKDMEVSAGRLQENIGELLISLGDAGASGAIAGFLDQLSTGASAWSQAIADAKLLAEANKRLAIETGASAESQADLGKEIGAAQLDIVGAGLQRLANWYYGVGEATDGLADKVQEVATEQAASAAAADANAKALQAESDAALEDAAAQGDLAAKLADANAARRDFAGAIIDIEAKAAEDTAATWDDFYKESQAATEAHNENIVKINADSEKERLANEKQLASDLIDVDADLGKAKAKLYKDLGKDLAKLDRDTNKQILRLQQDKAMEEKQQRNQRRIDAKGDERLFQFDMRQLAAEGSFNAIQEAMERRAIEKEIEGEKLKEEQTAKDETSRLEIDRIRADAEERKREAQAEAQARKEELETAAQERTDQLNEQAAEEEVRRQDELTQALAAEQTSYDERMDALAQHRDEKLAAIEEAKNEALAKQMEELVELGALTDEELAALVDKAYARGEEIGAAVAHGMAKAYAKEQQISEFLGTGAEFGAGPGGPNSAGHNNPGGQATPGHGANIGHPGAFASGGAFTVGGFGGTDSQLVSFFASPNEKVTVQTPAQQAGGGNIVINQTINGGSEDLARRIAAVTKAAAEREVERYHSEVIVPWAGG